MAIHHAHNLDGYLHSVSHTRFSIQLFSDHYSTNIICEPIHSLPITYSSSKPTRLPSCGPSISSRCQR
ncbi:hypothetical protein SCLCIDRAFT_701310 [Scleroderma citrinum Foug A]|uniref:Uncharacterized protein n=1 Tax=Scleroderma citrinum Foug A TaxID=1036808 RepID=A0A0C3EMI7_9AGAM|nr:hypothetical protein SCLCIDRAFT_701310 [Scleroderma citrinum Foug A]